MYILYVYIILPFAILSSFELSKKFLLSNSSFIRIYIYGYMIYITHISYIIYILHFQGWRQNRGVALPYTFKFNSLLVQMKLLAEGTELGNLQTN